VLLVVGAAAAGGVYAWKTGLLDSLSGSPGPVITVSGGGLSTQGRGARCLGVPVRTSSSHATRGSSIAISSYRYPQAPAKPDYGAVRKAIEDVLDVDGYDDGSYGPVLVTRAGRGRTRAGPTRRGQRGKGPSGSGWRTGTYGDVLGRRGSCGLFCLRMARSCGTDGLMHQRCPPAPYPRPHPSSPEGAPGMALCGDVRQGQRHRRLQRCHHALRS
jgi:hypothetical protein